jgi:hypothetical protein
VDFSATCSSSLDGADQLLMFFKVRHPAENNRLPCSHTWRCSNCEDRRHEGADEDDDSDDE